MQIEIKRGEVRDPIKAKDLPIGSIGKVVDTDGDALYVIHTYENGHDWLIVWPDSIPPAIEALNDLGERQSWEVEQLPADSTLTLKF